MLWLYDMSTIGLAGWLAAVFVGFTWLGVLFMRSGEGAAVGRILKSYLSEEGFFRPTYMGTGIIFLEASFGAAGEGHCRVYDGPHTCLL